LTILASQPLIFIITPLVSRHAPGLRQDSTLAAFRFRRH